MKNLEPEEEEDGDEGEGEEEPGEGPVARLGCWRVQRDWGKARGKVGQPGDGRSFSWCTGATGDTGTSMIRK